MDHLPWAGSEELWYLAAEKLLSNGHQVDVHYAAYRGWSPKLGELVQKGARIFPFGFKNVRANYWVGGIVRKLKGDPKYAPLPHTSDWKEADLILVSQGGCHDGQGWLELLARRKRPFAVLCQANTEAWWPSDLEASRLCDLFQTARRTFFVSQENLRLFCAQTGFNGENSVVIWNPCQPNTPKEPIPWPSGTEGTNKIAIVGRIEPFAKGQDLMIEVMSQQKWRDRTCQVTIFGKGPWEQTARRIVRDRMLTNIVFGGYAEPQEIWENHHILALPSRHEGMALAMIEALWLGRPVVATAVAGAVSVIKEGLNGFLAPAATVPLWDEAMDKAWHSRDDWEKMGTHAAREIRKIFPPDPGESLAELLTQLVSDHATPS